MGLHKTFISLTKKNGWVNNTAIPHIQHTDLKTATLKACMHS